MRQFKVDDTVLWVTEANTKGMPVLYRGKFQDQAMIWMGTWQCVPFDQLRALPKPQLTTEQHCDLIAQDLIDDRANRNYDAMPCPTEERY